MIIPELDQALATIKATEIQHRNGYHLSAQDLKDFNDAIAYINRLALKVRKSI